MKYSTFSKPNKLIMIANSYERHKVRVIFHESRNSTSLKELKEKLEKNGMFVYESVPGTAVENFKATENVVSFKVCGETDFQFTLGMEADAEYVVYMDDVNIGDMTTNLSGKLSVSAEADPGKEIGIKVVRK